MTRALHTLCRRFTELFIRFNILKAHLSRFFQADSLRMIEHEYVFLTAELYVKVSFLLSEKEFFFFEIPEMSC